MQRDATGGERADGRESVSGPTRQSSLRVTDVRPALGIPIGISGGIAVLLLVLAILVLDKQGRRELWIEVGKLSLQFLLVVLLGLVVTTALERYRERQAKWQADRQRAREQEEEYIRRLIAIARHVDQIRVMIAANRSVVTWTTEMKEHIVPAYADLRNLRHDLRTAREAEEVVFHDDAIEAALDSMTMWFRDFSGEFAENKKAMSARQKAAEDGKITHEQLWREMLGLPMLSDLILDRPDGRYGEFRGHYVRALTAMRGELRG